MTGHDPPLLPVEAPDMAKPIEAPSATLVPDSAESAGNMLSELEEDLKDQLEDFKASDTAYIIRREPRVGSFDVWTITFMSTDPDRQETFDNFELNGLSELYELWSADMNQKLEFDLSQLKHDDRTAFNNEWALECANHPEEEIKALRAKEFHYPRLTVFACLEDPVFPWTLHVQRSETAEVEVRQYLSPQHMFEDKDKSFPLEPLRLEKLGLDKELFENEYPRSQHVTIVDTPKGKQWCIETKSLNGSQVLSAHYSVLVDMFDAGRYNPVFLNASEAELKTLSADDKVRWAEEYDEMVKINEECFTSDTAEQSPPPPFDISGYFYDCARDDAVAEAEKKLKDEKDRVSTAQQKAVKDLMARRAFKNARDPTAGYELDENGNTVYLETVTFAPVSKPLTVPISHDTLMVDPPDESFQPLIRHVDTTEKYWEHYDEVKDAEHVARAINIRTRLVKLKSVKGRHGRGSKQDEDLQSRAKQSSPQPPTQILLNIDGTEILLPVIGFSESGAKQTVNHNGIMLRATVSEGGYHPGIMLKMQFRTEDSDKVTTCCIEWKFVAANGTSLINGFKSTPKIEGDSIILELSFTTEARPIFAGGWSDMAKELPRMTPQDRKLFFTVRNLAKGPKLTAPVPVLLKQHCERAQVLGKRQAGVRDEMKEKLAAQAPRLDPKILSVFEHLPGFGGEQKYVPPSYTSKPYKAWRNDKGHIPLKDGKIRGPWDLMFSQVLAHAENGERLPTPELILSDCPAPMTELASANYFASFDAARVKLANAAHYEFQEEALKLEMFCKPRHRIRLYSMGTMVVIAVAFNNYQKLNGDDEVHTRVPDGTKVSVSWKSGEKSAAQEAEGITFVSSVFYPDCDMTILVTNRMTATFGSQKGASDSNQAKKWKDMETVDEVGRERYLRAPYSAKLDIRPNTALYTSQLRAIGVITDPVHNGDFAELLLNQQPGTMQPEKVAAKLTDPTDRPELDKGSKEEAAWISLVDEAYDYILTYKPDGKPDFKWNSEQMEVLVELRQLSQKVLIVVGPAGTGKSTLEAIQCWFFFEIGYHVLFTAPANSNVDYMVLQIVAAFPGSRLAKDLIRIVPNDAEYGKQRLSDKYAPDTKGAPSSSGSFDHDPGDFEQMAVYAAHLAIMNKEKNKFDNVRAYTLSGRIAAHAVSEEPDKLTLVMQYGEGDAAPKRAPPAAKAKQSKKGADLGENLTFEEDDNATHEDDDDDGLESEPEADLFVPAPTYAEALSAHIVPIESNDELGRLPEGWSMREKTPDVNYFFNELDQSTTWLDPRLGEVDMFAEVKRFMILAREKNIWDWDEPTRKRFTAAFRYCGKFLVARSRFILTTSSMSSCETLQADWAKEDRSRCDPVIGVVVIVDEAAKDVEPNFWIAITGPWRPKIRAVIAVGDQKQLRPTVTSSRGEVQYSQFVGQLVRSVIDRWVEEGVNHCVLTRQTRMHPFLAQFPSEDAYGGAMSSDDNLWTSINHEEPGLRENVLIPLFKECGTERDLRDDQLRLHWFEVAGKVRMNQNTKSRANMEQLDFCMKRLLPRQSEHYQENTSKICMWITGYKEQVALIDRAFVKYLSEHPDITRDHLPKVRTIDSCQGDEAQWIVFMVVANDGDKKSDLGFLHDQRRINVATTRALTKCTIVSGPCEGRLNRPKPGHEKSVPYLFRFKKFLAVHGCNTELHDWPQVPEEDVPFHLREAKPIDEGEASEAWVHNDEAAEGEQTEGGENTTSGEETVKTVENKAAKLSESTWGGETVEFGTGGGSAPAVRW